MKKLNRKLLLLLVAAVLLANISMVYAYTKHSTDPIVNTLLPAVVDAEVVETFDGVDKSVIKAKNASNVEAYLRLKVITYWQDSKGNVVARAPKALTIDYDTQNWLLKDGIYYYKYPVAPGETTAHNLLKTNIKLASDSETVNHVTYTYHQVVEITAEAIQSKPVDAVQDSWKVTVNTDHTLS